MADVTVATVESVTGKAYARNAGGELRELRTGDALVEGETVVTPDGGRVELSLEDGSPLVINDAPEITLTRDLVAETAAGADESAVEDETIDQVLAALESGEDLGDVLEATAAGASGGSGGDGSSFIRLGRIVEETNEFTGLVGSQGASSEVPEDENFLPVDAIDDAVETEAGEPVIINVQANDIFIEGSSVTETTQPENGSVVINADDTVTYTPKAGFVGTDTFTYTAVSPDGTGSDTALVTVTVIGEVEPPAPPPPPPPPEEPPVISISDDVVFEGDTAMVTISLSKPWDEDVTVSYESGNGSAIAPGDYTPGSGSVTIPAGEISIQVPFSTNDDNIQEADENFFVSLSNPVNAVIADDLGVVTIVDDTPPPPPPPPPPTPTPTPTPTPPVNNPPDAVDDQFSTEVNTPISATVVLNDSDPDGDSFTVVSNTQPLHGTVIVNPDGTFTYTPDTDFNGDDSFEYTISDGEGGQDTATVSILVNDSPVDLQPSARGIQSVFPEALLPGGSAEDPAALSKDGSFTVTAKDGLDTLTINGVEVVADGEVTLTNVVTDTGIQVTITDVAPGADGVYTINYTATLTERFQHAPGSDEKSVAFNIVVADTDGDEASAQRSATILDDLPQARDDMATVNEGDVVFDGQTEQPGASVSGNVRDGDGVGGVADVQGADALANNVTLLSAAAGTNGDLALGPDGGYTYTLNQAGLDLLLEELEGSTGIVADTFDYEIVDQDGDVSTATLTIRFQPDGDVTVMVPQVETQDAGTLVSEAGLPGDRIGDVPNETEGSAGGADNSDITSGTITFNVEDVLGSISIGGVPIDLNNAVGTLIPGENDFGQLRIDSFDPNGTIEYTYTLADNTAGNDTQDTFQVIVADTDGESDSSQLVIAITDDQPMAIDDTDALVGANTSVTGNVITGASEAGTGAADTLGADNAAITLVTGLGVENPDDSNPLTATGQYGTLVMLADGTYTYARTAAFDVSGQDVFTYTLTDTDGDPSTATLSIVVPDASNPPELTIIRATGDDGIVHESQLPTTDVAPFSQPWAGTGVGGDLTSAGTIRVTATLGLASVLLNGSIEVVGGKSFDGDHGTLVIDAFAETPQDSGIWVAGYTYTLKESELHDDADPDFDTFSFQAIDVLGDDSGTPESLTVDIANDTPLDFLPDTAILMPGASLSGELNFNDPAATAPDGSNKVGADGFRASDPVVFNLVDGSPVTDAFGNNIFYGVEIETLTWVKVSDTQFQAQTVGDGRVAITAVLDGDADDNYTVTLGDEVFTLQGDNIPFTPGEGIISGGNSNYFGITDLGGNGSIVDVVFSGTEAGGGVTTVNTDASVYGLGQGQSINAGEEMRLDFYANSNVFDNSDVGPLDPVLGTSDGQPLATRKINNFEFTIQKTDTNFDGEQYLAQAWVYDTGAPGGVREVFSEQGDARLGTTVLVGGSENYNFVTITAIDGDVTGKNFAIQVEGFSQLEPSDIALRLPVTGYDADGDAATGDIVFGIDQPTDAGEPGLPNIVHASSEDDSLLGSDGETDIFTFEVGDVADAPEGVADTISSFDPASDVLDLRDLLQGEESIPLENYLHVSSSGDHTVIQIDSNGGGDPATVFDQSITLLDVDFVDLGINGADPMAQIIDDLLTAGTIITD